MIYNVELSYSDCKKIEEMSGEDYQELRKIIITLPEEQSSWISQFLIDQEGLLKLLEMGMHPTIKQVKNTYSPSKPDGGWSDNLEAGKSAIHVHVPNIGLLMIDIVKVLENSCTDVLQEHLDNGWRIIAVCPPNGVRRPDYVLGRQKTILQK